ncbi:MAG: sulfotransferase [Proteobacteria bacterium]|nr:sulfotransferase [Pseudomonadota bacterium]
MKLSDPQNIARSAGPDTDAALPVLVLGMHRSGTSVLARTLNLLGIAVGDNESLLPAHPTDNPSGYWERSDIVACHDEFLAAGGYSWSRVAGFSASDLGLAVRQALEKRLRQSIAQLDRSGRPWLVKDPRLCLLVSQWLPLFDQIACVVAVRDPRDVAASILRERLRGAYTSNFLLMLWEKYLRTAMSDLSGKRALFVSYERLLADPLRESTRIKHALTELGVAGLHDPITKELGDFVNPALRRSEGPAHSEMSDSQQRLFAWLEAQAKAPSAILVEDVPDGMPPDAVLREYEQTFDYFTEVGRNRAITDLATQAGAVKDGLSPLLEEFSARQEQAYHATFGEIMPLVQQRVRDLESAIFESRERESALRGRIDELVADVERSADTHRKVKHALESELKVEVAKGSELAKRIVQLESALSEMTSELETTRASRDRALDAAVKTRRALDEQLNARNGES